MSLPEHLEQLNQEIASIVSPGFPAQVERIRMIPARESDLPPITAGEEGYHAYSLHTCVLSVDIRRSLLPESKGRAHDKAKVYFAFLRVIAKAAEYHGGRVVNMAGDRMMVVFEDQDCFTDAVNTAFLLNTVTQRILQPNFPHRTIRCGIGIDYGRIIVSRVPVLDNAAEAGMIQKLVWLGKPTYRAAKLMESADRQLRGEEGAGLAGLYFHGIKEWTWRVLDEYSNLLNALSPRSTADFTGPSCRLSHLETEPGRIEPILMTGSVLRGLRAARPDDVSLRRLWWRKKAIRVPNYNGEIYGTNVIYLCREG